MYVRDETEFFSNGISLRFDERWNKNASLCSFITKTTTTRHFIKNADARDYILICYSCSGSWNEKQHTQYASCKWHYGARCFHTEQNRRREPNIWEYIIQQLRTSGLICLRQGGKKHYKRSSIKKQTCTSVSFFFYIFCLFITSCEQGDRITDRRANKPHPLSIVHGDPKLPDASCFLFITTHFHSSW